MEKILHDVIDPALSTIEDCFGVPKSNSSRAMLIAIGLQESLLKHRYQVLQGGGKGPARGLWQFEKGGGVKGVLTHARSAPAAKFFCMEEIGTTELERVWAELECNDFLACIFARLLLLTDPKPLPMPGDVCADEAWRCYERNWRPGKPHPEKWAANWQKAINLVAP